MQTREKLLAIGLGSVLAIGWVIPAVWEAVRAPVTEREQDLKSLKRRLDTREVDEMKTMAAIKRLADYRGRSLSEDALTAQRVYQAWLTQLADESGWENLQVIPGRTKPVGPGTSVSVTVEGLATTTEVADFLRLFNESGVLHSIEDATFSAETTNSDVPIEVSVTATALSLPDGGARPLPYAGLTVAEETDDPELARVTPSLGKVTEPFDVEAKIGGKTLVATVKGTTEEGLLKLKWDDESPKRLDEGLAMTTRPYEVEIDRAAPAWDSFAKLSPFSIPKPVGQPTVVSREPTKDNMPPVLEAVDGASLLPGERWQAKVIVSDPDGDDGKVKLRLDDAPRGARIEGDALLFEVPPGTAPGDVVIEVVASDDGGGESRMGVTLQVMADPETTTELVGAVRINNEPAAWFIDRKTGERIVRRIGDELKAGRFEAKIQSIGITDVVFVSTEATSRLELGERLSERQTMPNADPAPADETEQPSSESGERNE